VAGRNVRSALIYDVVPSQFSGEDLQSELEYLVSIDILMRDRNGYCFKHEMVQEVVLGFLTFSQKRFLHKRIAGFYVNNEREDEISAATLASHFELAAIGMDTSELDVPACKRATWFLKVAAEEAMKANAIEDANRYLSRCHELMQMLPSNREPFDLEMALGLVDGNEALLRQVLDQFRSNTEVSIDKMDKAVARIAGAAPHPAKADVDEVRFEARSIESAASTLGAEGLSHSALALEAAVVDTGRAEGFEDILHKIKTDFVDLMAFINSHTSSKTATTLVLKGDVRAGDSDKASAPMQDEGATKVQDASIGDPLDAILQDTSSSALPSNNEEHKLVDQMMNDQLFHTS